mgnify:CR=1 FL=1
MEAKELRIGNLVLWNDEIVPIDLISKESVNVLHNNSATGWYTVDINDIKPVVLTPALLLKFNFKQSSEHVFDHDYAVFDAPNNWNDTSDYPVGIDASNPMFYGSPEIIIRAIYAHDLQNKFFTITGKELEMIDCEPQITGRFNRKSQGLQDINVVDYKDLQND